MAANKGFNIATFTLASIYDNGQVVAQNYVEAVKWYRLGAENNNTDAQFNLGALYAKGQGVPQNLIKAYGWIYVPVLKGDAAAKDSLNKIAKLMSPKDIAIAEKLARDCLARNFKGCD